MSTKTLIKRAKAIQKKAEPEVTKPLTILRSIVEPNGDITKMHIDGKLTDLRPPYENIRNTKLIVLDDVEARL